MNNNEKRTAAVKAWVLANPDVQEQPYIIDDVKEQPPIKNTTPNVFDRVKRTFLSFFPRRDCDNRTKR
jgi:hypothetical protein